MSTSSKSPFHNSREQAHALQGSAFSQPWPGENCYLHKSLGRTGPKPKLSVSRKKEVGGLLLQACGDIREAVVSWVDSFSILANHGSFRNPDVSLGFPRFSKIRIPGFRMENGKASTRVSGSRLARGWRLALGCGSLGRRTTSS